MSVSAALSRLGIVAAFVVLGCESPEPLPPAREEAAATEVRNLLARQDPPCPEPADPTWDGRVDAMDEGADADRLEAWGERQLRASAPCRASRFLGRAADLRESSDPAAARELYRRAFRAAAEGLDLPQAARLLNGLGLLEVRQGRFRVALSHYSGARLIYRELGAERTWATTHANIGGVYFRMGRWREAGEVLDEAIARLEKERDARSVRPLAAALNYRGRVHLAEGRMEAAEEVLQQSLDLRRRHGLALAPGLDPLAQVYMRSERLDAAEALWVQAEALLSDQPAAWANVQANLGELGLFQERPEEAIRRARLALEHAAEHGVRDPNLRLHAWWVEARAHLALGREDLFVDGMERVTAQLEAMRASFPGDLMQHFFAHRRSYLDPYVDFLARGGQEEEAFEVMELIRARGLLDQLVTPPAELRAEVSPDLLARDEHLRRELERLGRRQGDAPSEPTRGARELRLLLMDLEAEMRLEVGVPVARTANLETARRHVAASPGPEPLVLIYWLGEGDSLLFTLDRGELRFAGSLGSRRGIEGSVENLWQLMARGETSRDPAAAETRALGARLLGPIVDRLTPERPVVVVPDGLLGSLSFATLEVPGRDGRRLVDDHAVSLLPSFSVLDTIRHREGKRRAPSGKPLVVVADPVYGPRDPRCRGCGEPEPGRSYFPRLPGAAREAERLEALAEGVGGAELYLGTAASRRRILDGAVAGSRFIHFGTHAEARPATPDLSSLELSVVDSRGRPVEGSLYLRDLDTLDLDADLVTLAGCETARGELLRGEGVVSLPRGFLRAGARAVVASLWPVDDASTGALVEELYRGILVEGLAPVHALRRAQRSLAESERWSDPSHWGAFVLFGDWSAAGDSGADEKKSAAP